MARWLQRLPSELMTGQLRTIPTVIEYHLLRMYELTEPYADDQATFASVRAMQLEHAKKGARTTAAELAPHWFAARWLETEASRSDPQRQARILQKIERIPWGKPPKRKTKSEETP